MVLLSIVVAGHWRDPVGIPRIQGACKHEHIHDNRDGGDSIFPYITKHRPVEHHRDNPGDKGGGHLRASVCRRICQDFEPEDRLLKMQKALFPAEYEHTRDGCHRISKTRRNRRAADAHLESGDEQIVKRHVQDAARYRANQRKSGLFAGNHIEREVIHQEDWNGKYQVAA